MTARKYLNERRTSIILMMLLGGDLVFIGMHFINIFTPLLSHASFDLESDTGYAEKYQYFKFCLIIALFTAVALKNSTRHYFAWALVFTYLLFDDSLTIHELVGDSVAREANFISGFGLGAEDCGELAAMVFAGISLIAILAWTYKNGTQTFKGVSRDLVPFMIALFFCAVVVDMLHNAIDIGTAGALLLGLLEDGGEMLTVSFILWYVWLINVYGDSFSCLPANSSQLVR